MLLRRITEHVRNQNWFAVGIDFFIVVVGVFVGIQVSNWNDFRKENSLASDYLRRLHDDMTLSIDATEGTRKFINANTNGISLVLDSLETCVLVDKNRDTFANGLYHAGKHIPATFADGTLKELRSSGRLGLIKNTHIRDLLIEADREIEYQARVWPSVQMRARNQTTYMDQIIIFRLDQPKGGFSVAMWDELDVDFDGLCQDRRFRAAVAVQERLGHLNIDWLDRNLENFHETRNALEIELGMDQNAAELTP